QSRLVVGLGLPQPVETGFLLDRLTGCPYLPGSSVKGLLRSAARLVAREEVVLGEEPDAAAFWEMNLRRLFGPEAGSDNAAARGQLVAFDAFPDPWPRLEVDVLTPHHSQYYTGNGGHYPADWDDPSPVPFLTVAPGTRFVFHFGFSDSETVEADFARVRSLLWGALDAFGVGGKKAAGYGFFGESAPPKPRRIDVGPPARPPQTERGRRTQAPPPPPTSPAQEVPWSNVTLTLHEGKPTVIRNRKPAATCAPKDVDPKVLAALKQHRQLRADVDVVKLPTGPARLVRVRSWTPGT
ncbi:MAG: type III-B CRISPR module RAMP protein Cmr6, partial [Thermoanaerobaculia bacterium]